MCLKLSIFAACFVKGTIFVGSIHYSNRYLDKEESKPNLQWSCAPKGAGFTIVDLRFVANPSSVWRQSALLFC